MKYIVVFLSLLFFSCTSKPDIKANVDKKMPAKMQETFPFSEADRIEVISFEYKDYWDINEEGNYKIIDGKLAFDESIIKERVILNSRIEKNLFKVLNSEICPDESGVYDCYTPEHRVLFYDENSKLIAYLEICFQCKDYRISDGWKTVGFCDQNLEELKTLFKDAGIKHFTEH